MNKYLPYIAAFTSSSIFGFSFLFTKEGLELINPFHLLAFRFGLAALILTILSGFKFIKINYSKKKMNLLLLLAIIQPGLYFVFETLGINLTTSSEAGLMIALIPVAVTMLAIFFLHERPTLFQACSILLSVTGVFFIIFMKGLAEVNNNSVGLLLLSGAVLMAAFYNILSRKLSLDFNPIEITYVMMWIGAIFFNIISIYQFRGNISLYLLPLKNAKVLGSVLYLGILSSIVAFFLVNYALSKIEAAQSAIFANLSTVISILAGVLIRHEPFYWYQIIGSIMIITGVWGTSYFGSLKKKNATKYTK